MDAKEPDHEIIYLEPKADDGYGSEGRLWCQDDVWTVEDGGPGVKFIRADIADARLSSARSEGARAHEKMQWLLDDCRVHRDANTPNETRPFALMKLREREAAILDCLKCFDPSFAAKVSMEAGAPTLYQALASARADGRSDGAREALERAAKRVQTSGSRDGGYLAAAIRALPSTPAKDQGK